MPTTSSTPSRLRIVTVTGLTQCANPGCRAIFTDIRECARVLAMRGGGGLHESRLGAGPGSAPRFVDRGRSAVRGELLTVPECSRPVIVHIVRADSWPVSHTARRVT